MTDILKKARKGGSVTVVNLVFDFRSEINNAGKKWKLGVNDDAYPYIDLLIADRDEAIKTSGQATTDEAIAWFIKAGAGAVIVTEGARAIKYAAGKGIFAACPVQTLPVCEEVDKDLARYPERRGDTTGCGDNFAGGIITGLAKQLEGISRDKLLAPGKLDIVECIVHGAPAGGFACFTVGGTYYEKSPGEKREKLAPYIAAYREQIKQLLK
jgi:sugar/nucleoside kinase (ribokinase family)